MRRRKKRGKKVGKGGGRGRKKEETEKWGGGDVTKRPVGGHKVDGLEYICS